MTTLEHAMVGANLVLASGLNRRFGWQLVAMAGVCAILPDWDGLTILWSVPLFDVAHRSWGHGLLPCMIVTAVFALLDYRFDFMTRLAQWFSRWIKMAIPPEQLERRRTFTLSDVAVWIAVGTIAALSHLLADMVVSGTATLSDWDVKLLWPFSDRGFVYPLVPWGDVGNMLILIVGMFVMLRWKNRVQLIAAVNSGLIEWVRYFIDKGLSLDAKNRWNQTPLYLAAKGRQWEIVKLLIERGASTEPPPTISPIFYAIMLHQNDVLEKILQADRAAANRFSQDHDGDLWNKMPLVVALEYDNNEAVELLIKYGASITGAKITTHQEGAWGDSALTYVSRTGMKEMLLRFLREKININSKSSPRPALHCAASIEIIRILLDYGANPYLRSNEHRTALECQLQNKDVAALLREVMSREPEN